MWESWDKVLESATQRITGLEDISCVARLKRLGRFRLATRQLDRGNVKVVCEMIYAWCGGSGKGEVFSSFLKNTCAQQ